MMNRLAWILELLFVFAALAGPGVEAMTYAVTMHYADSDTSCGRTPYRIDVFEDTECSEWSCQASINGLFDGMAFTVCTKDYQNEVWTRFGGSVYILQVLFHDSVCSNFAYARAYLANGECGVGANSNYFTAKVETNGSATLQFYTTESCSPDDIFLRTERSDKETLESNACDSSEYEWFTNQGNMAAPLESTTTAGSSNSAGTSSDEADATGTMGTTSADTTTDAATSPSTSTTDNTSTSSSSGGGDTGLSIGAIVGIAAGGLVAVATVYALIFHPDRPISFTCFSLPSSN